jgi:type IX secretion system PorP/SprF family membrane protein
MKKKCLLTLFGIIFLINAYGQQDAQYSQYMFNSMVINPAYAGYKEAINVSLLHRDQWTGIDGAPKTQSIVVDGAFFSNKKVGLGISVLNDKVGLQNQSSVYANYAYRLPVGEEDARLSFGLAIGVAQFVLNGRDAIVDDPNDQNFLGGKQTYFTPDAKFGVFFSDKKFYAGLSATNLLAKSIDYQQVGNNTISKQGRHYFLTAGYLFEINDYLKFKPSFLIKEDTKGPTSLDINSFALLKETVWLGASYRTGVNLWKKNSLNTSAFNQNSLIGVVEVFLKKNVRVGYAYDYTLSSLSSYSSGTHEISLGLIINSNKKSTLLLTPRYF